MGKEVVTNDWCKFYPAGFLIAGRLTLISVASLGKLDPDQMPQNAASGQGLHCLHTDISIKNEKILQTCLNLAMDSSN